MQKRKAILIGAGLTGLTTAYYLRKAGWEILVLEKNSEVGGAMKTVCEDGFVFETGANTGVLGNPETAELFEELSDLCTLEIANPKAKKRLILKKGKLHALPSGLLSAVTTPLFTWGDKFRVLVEPFRKKGTDEFETIANIIRRRMGKSFLDYAIDPFVSGIYAGDPEQLAIKYALPKMWAFEYKHGSFIKGGMKRSKEMKSDPRLQKATRDVISTKGGFGNLINALAQKTGRENIVCSAENVVVHQLGELWEVSYFKNGKPFLISADYVITTVASVALPSMLSFLPHNQLQTICNVNYAKVTEVLLGFKKWNGPSLQAFGCLIPSRENRKVLGILYSSSFLENRAPKGGALLTIYLGGIRHPEYTDWSDDVIQQTVIEEVESIIGVSNILPDVVKIFRHSYAIPQYSNSTKERIAAVEEAEKHYKGLVIAGNLRNGIGMADRIKQATDIVEKINKI